jgi:uridine kinase
VRVVCIDGPAGSGKTMLSAALADELTASGAPIAVVHLDDLYEGWAQPLGMPLSARVEAWLLVPWRDGLPGRYPRYDWGQERFTEWHEVPVPSVAILEGCGSAARAIRARASLVVWIEAAQSVRLARGLERDGVALTDAWLHWQQTEQEHFAADGTRAAADVLLTT